MLRPQTARETAPTAQPRDSALAAWSKRLGSVSLTVRLDIALREQALDEVAAAVAATPAERAAYADARAAVRAHAAAAVIIAGISEAEYQAVQPLTLKEARAATGLQTESRGEVFATMVELSAAAVSARFKGAA